jgi:RNA polymerase sigma-70 factor (ECF subfamily)
VLPHEPDVRIWLRRRFPDAEADDVIQEAYSRIAGARIGGISSGRAYFIATARNIVIEQMRRRRVVRFQALSAFDAESLVDEAPSPEQITAHRRRLDAVREVVQVMPALCREIFTLRKFYGYSQREIAGRLGVSENIVEKEVARGVRLVLETVSGDGSPQYANTTASRRSTL